MYPSGISETGLNLHKLSRTRHFARACKIVRTCKSFTFESIRSSFLPFPQARATGISSYRPTVITVCYNLRSVGVLKILALSNCDEWLVRKFRENRIECRTNFDLTILRHYILVTIPIFEVEI